MYKYIISAEQKNMRLDKALVFLLTDMSRTYISKLIDEGKCLVNGKVGKASYKLSENDVVEIDVPEVKELEITKEDIPLEIVYEDKDILVINKPQGLVVHPAPGHYEHTLVNAVLAHTDDLSGINGVKRPGIVHRIDKDTSGLLCIAKNDEAHEGLAEQLKDHSMSRKYIALVKGVIKEKQGEIDLPIGRSRGDRKKMAVDTLNGKPARTFFTIIKRYQEHTLIECSLETGRTHQIRVHMAHIGHPVEGDPLYNKKNATSLYDKGQLLVAYKLHLVHPINKKEMDFEIPLPTYFTDILNRLN
jgi:23S rRNA pseudouridine1911/1915/1917 synthase